MWGIFFLFFLQREWFFYDHRRGKRVFVLAYSGVVFSKMFEGDFLFLLLTAVVFSRKPSRGCPSGRDSEDREGRGRCSNAAPSPLPTLRDLPPSPLIQALP